jgi:hypothetical protein
MNDIIRAELKYAAWDAAVMAFGFGGLAALSFAAGNASFGTLLAIASLLDVFSAKRRWRMSKGG